MFHSELQTVSPIVTNVDHEVLLIHRIGRKSLRVWDLPSLMRRDHEKIRQTAIRAGREILETSLAVDSQLLGSELIEPSGVSRSQVPQRFMWFGAVVVGTRPSREHRPYYDELQFISSEMMLRQLPHLSQNAQAFYHQWSEGAISIQHASPKN